jgi:hypothetical protein
LTAPEYFYCGKPPWQKIFLKRRFFFKKLLQERLNSDILYSTYSLSRFKLDLLGANALRRFKHCRQEAGKRIKLFWEKICPQARKKQRYALAHIRFEMIACYHLKALAFGL